MHSGGWFASRDDREINVKRIGYIANVLSRNGVIALVSAISPYASARSAVRRLHQREFVEVYVDCSLAELIRRDPKGMYAKALSGEIGQFTGISDPYEVPTEPDLTVHTDQENVAASTATILKFLESRALFEPRAGSCFDPWDDQVAQIRVRAAEIVVEFDAHYHFSPNGRISISNVQASLGC